MARKGTKERKPPNVNCLRFLGEWETAGRANELKWHNVLIHVGFLFFCFSPHVKPEHICTFTLKSKKEGLNVEKLQKHNHATTRKKKVEGVM